MRETVLWLIASARESERGMIGYIYLLYSVGCVSWRISE